MSDKGRAYVTDHSPYSGTMRFIHYILGGLENDTYDHRLFTGDKWIAKAAGCSTRTVMRAKAQMIADGLLEVIDDRTAPGKVAEYRFLFPGTGDTVSPVGEERVTSETERVTNGASAPYIETRDTRGAQKRARIPDPFLLTAKMREWAKTRAPDVDLRVTTEEFVTYWRGDGRVKADWEQTWRNAMLKAQQRARPHPVANGANSDGLAYDPDRPDVFAGLR